MGRHTDLTQPQHQIFADTIVQHTLAGDGALLFVAKGRRIILEVLDQCTGLGAFEQNLGLAFINLSASGHGKHTDEKCALGTLIGGARWKDPTNTSVVI